MSGRAKRPGKASLKGLEKIVKLGAVDREAWAAMMGWSRSTAYSHASRLESAGLVERTRTEWAANSLLVATRTGAEYVGREDLGQGKADGPSSWAQARANTWVAAWLDHRGEQWWSSREMRAANPAYWRVDARGAGNGGAVSHFPDFAALRGEDEYVVYDVATQLKRAWRRRAILEVYRRRISDPRHQMAGVVYVASRPGIMAAIKGDAKRLNARGAVDVLALPRLTEEARGHRGHRASASRVAP